MTQDTMTEYQAILNTRRIWNPHDVAPATFDYDCLDRILAIGLNCELPVGEWVHEARTELPNSHDAMKLLQANQADEGVHYRGFKKFEESYGVFYNYYDHAEQIAEQWREAADRYHFLDVAGTMETGVFLCTLFTMRFFGDQEYGNLSEDISKDEQRHIRANELCLNEVGESLMQISPRLETLRKETLDWVFDGFSPGLGINKDWMMDQSEKLLYEGYAPDLAELSNIATYTPSFEISNDQIY